MSTSTYASFAALAVLENPRKITAKGLVFDGSFFSGLPEPQPKSLVASLRYFNAKDEAFPELGLYFVYATLAQMDPAIEVFTGEGSGSDMKPDDFHLVGDIQFLFHLGHPGETSIDYRQVPYVHICGPALNADQAAATFTVTAEPYTSAFRELQKKAGLKKAASGPKSLFSAACKIHDSARYDGGKKPVPFNRRFVMAAGKITGMSSTLENGKVNDTYQIAVENIVFLGNYVPPATPSVNSPVPSSSTSTTTPANRLKRWSYDTPVANSLKRQKSDADDDGSSVVARSSSPTP
ncbi:hypothetical protein C8R45DRAFT_1097141 [Mycena sanguinolenta]|nr:hypothetical protein C8R45DRAFT_1097141 [Mycena sanguinolenta]